MSCPVLPRLVLSGPKCAACALKLQLPRVLAGATFLHLAYNEGRNQLVRRAMQQVFSYMSDKVSTEGYASCMRLRLRLTAMLSPLRRLTASLLPTCKCIKEACYVAGKFAHIVAAPSHRPIHHAHHHQQQQPSRAGRLHNVACGYCVT